MDEKPDHGDIVAQRVVPITRDDTALTLTRKLAAAGRLVFRETYPALASGTAARRPQDHAAASYFGRRRPEDGRIDWSRPAEAIRNLVRAVTDPWPGAFTAFRRRRLTVWGAETRAGGTAPGEIQVSAAGAPLVGTGDGLLELTDLTWDTEPRRSGREWARAAAVQAGERFDDTPTT
jgi:methionyl-tRNA formyltransferase